PTPIANSRDLEAHYVTYHAHVCEEQGCNCVFPDARLLEIHQTECHDPLVARHRLWGDDPAAVHPLGPQRRRHPREHHRSLRPNVPYAKEYFFAVTNKGVGGLLKRWGDGASLMRGQWKPRESPDTSEPPEPQSPSVLVEEDEMPTTSQQQPPTTGGGIDSLTDSLNALALVPPSIRFGRGGKNGGFSNEQQPRGGGLASGARRASERQRRNGRGHAPGKRTREGARSGGRQREHRSTRQARAERSWRGAGRCAEQSPSDPDILAYVSRGVRARGMLYVRGGARGRGV
ncbi:hypothetical protein B0H14DRAFT_2350655, partial [Mycena olivaceomarginata]